MIFEIEKIEKDFDKEINNIRNLKKLTTPDDEELSDIMVLQNNSNIRKSLDPTQDKIARRLLIAGIVMIWEDFINSILLMKEKKIITSDVIELLLKKRTDNNLKSIPKYLEMFDYIRIYRNLVVHNNCKKNIQETNNWSILCKKNIVINESEEVNLESKTIDLIVEDIKKQKEIIMVSIVSI